jgi:hypothetical protein
VRLDLDLNCISPWDKDKPYPKQQQYLEIDRGQPGVTHIDWTGGMGSAKTHTGELEAIWAMTYWCPGGWGMFTEPTWGKFDEAFWPIWEEMVPPELYTYHGQKRLITWANGSKMLLRSRNVDNARKTITILAGANLSWIIDDEMGDRCRYETYTQEEARLRVATPGDKDYRFHSTLSTPTLGAYQRIVETDGHIRINSTSADNPHNVEGWAEEFASQLSPNYKALWHDGLFVPLSGHVWPDWSDEEWPKGNIHWHEHDHNKPYYLFFDLGGATGAYLVVQALDARDISGNLLYREPVYVVTAEYMPLRTGAVEAIFPMIKEDFGRPIQIAVGHDVGSRGSMIEDTPMTFINNHFGAVPTTVVTHATASKEVQHSMLTRGIYNSNGQRRFCVSKGLRSYPGDTRRGIMTMLKQDHFPDGENTTRVWQTAMKEGVLEHVRDAALYGGCVMFPRTFGHGQPVGGGRLHR